MKIYQVRFNIILLLLCCVAFSACKSNLNKEEQAAAEKRKTHKKERSLLEFYLAGPAAMGGRNIRVGDMQLSIDAAPFLDSRSVAGARLLEHEFGYAIQIQFDSHGAFVLDTQTTSHRGKNLAIGLIQSGTEQRWLGAPIIHQRNASGTISFTPNVSREEAEKIVAGINNVVRQMNRPF